MTIDSRDHPGAGSRSGKAVPDDAEGNTVRQKLRILLVEDEAITAMHAELLLTGLGFEVCATATTGPAAVAAVARHRPDLVLMDIRLADDTDGIDAAAEIGERFGTPVVYMTAHSDAATVRRAESTRPLGFITKPYSREQLKTTLTQAVARLKDRQEG